MPETVTAQPQPGHPPQLPTARCTNAPWTDTRLLTNHAAVYGTCRKLWRRPCGRFIDLRESETKRQQPVLLAFRPGAGETNALPQPQHGFEPSDCASRRVERLKAGHGAVSILATKH